MKPVENPPRLRDHPEFGRDWSAAAENSVDAERLARLGESLSRAVEGLERGAGAAASTSGLDAARIAKISLPLLVVGAVVATTLLRESPEPHPQGAPVLVVDQDQHQGLGHAPGETHEPDSTPEPKEPERSLDRPPVRPARPKAAQDAVAPTPSPKSSELPDQLQEFRAAQAEAEAGDFNAAIARMTRFEARYPQSPLGPETQLARADWLIRAGRNAEATVQIQKLLLNPELNARQGTLFQLLGDSWMKRGRCDRALGAYEKALAKGIDPAQEATVRVAIEKCGGE